MTRAFVLPVFVVLVAAIGIIDAATAHAWDMVTLFAALGVLGIMRAPAPTDGRAARTSAVGSLTRWQPPACTT